jgi:hypothetical protein
MGLESVEVIAEAPLIAEIVRNAAVSLSGASELDCSVSSAAHGGIVDAQSKPAKAREMRFILF